MGSPHPSYSTLESRLRLALSRQEYAAMDWDQLIELAPLTWDDLGMVPDRSVR